MLFSLVLHVLSFLLELLGSLLDSSFQALELRAVLLPEGLDILLVHKSSSESLRVEEDDENDDLEDVVEGDESEDEAGELVDDVEDADDIEYLDDFEYEEDDRDE